MSRAKFFLTPDGERAMADEVDDWWRLKKPVYQVKKLTICDSCDGRGWIDGMVGALTVCPSCNGTGIAEEWVNLESALRYLDVVRDE